MLSSYVQPIVHGFSTFKILRTPQVWYPYYNLWDPNLFTTICICLFVYLFMVNGTGPFGSWIHYLAGDTLDPPHILYGYYIFIPVLKIKYNKKKIRYALLWITSSYLVGISLNTFYHHQVLNVSVEESWIITTNMQVSC